MVSYVSTTDGGGGCAENSDGRQIKIRRRIARVIDSNGNIVSCRLWGCHKESKAQNIERELWEPL